MESKNNWKAWLYLSPALILMAIFTFYPLISTFVMAFLKNFNYIRGTYEGFTFDNVGQVLGIVPYAQGATPETTIYMTDFIRYALPNTLFITVVTVPISIILALFIAIWLNSIKWLKGLFQTIFFLPYVTNVIAVGMVFAIMFSSTGVVNTVFGLNPSEWNWTGIGNAPSSWGKAMFVLCLYIIWNALPYKILIFLSGLQGIDKQYYEAAKIDSAPKWKTTLKITIPLLSPQILYIMITSFIGSFKEYTAVVGIFNSPSTGDRNVHDLYTVVYYIYDQLNQSTTVGRMAYAAAGAVILFVIIMLFTFVQMRISKKRVHY